MDSGFMILALIIGLYVTLGPLVFVFLYIIFDRLAEYEPKPKRKSGEILPKDNALLSPRHIRILLDRKKNGCTNIS
ncbi:MAG: hypothetical protein EOL86_09240 [Deltaproteobacteria bacterium]|nr:hypothetical protein [Deltaproteobacteria bacterium]